MANVLIVAYLLIVLAMIAVILLQRSEGGGLGMGGNAGGLMTVRGSANLLTRTTAILAALFFATAIGLTVLSEIDRGSSGILEQATGAGATTNPDGTPAATSVLDALNKLQNDNSGLSVPATTPATTDTTTAPAVPATDPGLALPTTTEPAPAAGTTTPPPATDTPAAPSN